MTNSKFTVEYEIADLMILLDLYQLGSVTAMFYGKEGEASRERFQQLQEQIQNLSPLPKHSRDKGYSWFNMCRCLSKHQDKYNLVFDENTWGTKITIVIGEHEFQIADRVKWEELPYYVPKLEDLLNEIRGINSYMIPSVYNPDYWQARKRREEKKDQT